MASIQIRERRVGWRRLLAGGIILVALSGLAGGAVELWRFGASEEAALARVEHLVRERVEAMVDAVSGASVRIASDPAAAAALTGGPDSVRILFDLAAAARQGARVPDDLAVTIYGTGGAAQAWAGEPSEIPQDRFARPATLFVMPSPLGLRLVHVRAIATAEGRRVGFVATEHELSPAPEMGASAAPEYMLDTPLVPARLRTRVEGAGEASRPDAVVLRAPDGEPLAEARIDPSDLRAARSHWRRLVLAVMVGLLAVTVLLLAGPFLDRRLTIDRTLPAREARWHYVRATVSAIVLAAAGGALGWTAWAIAFGAIPPAASSLLAAGGTAAAIVSLLVAPVSRLRVAMRDRRTNMAIGSAWFTGRQLLAGFVVAALLILFARVLDAAVNPASIDLRHFSLHPWRPARLTLLAGVLALHLATLWAGALVFTVAIAWSRVPRRWFGGRLALLALWVAPALLGVLVAWGRGWPVPALGLLMSAAACGIAALTSARLTGWYRRASVASRIFALFLAFLIPALLLYPSTDYFAERATRTLIESQYAVQAQNHVGTIQARMNEAQDEVTGMASLTELLRSTSAGPEPVGSGPAYAVWRQTVLARERLTSAVELYDVRGNMVSRFALNIPEYSNVVTQVTTATASGSDNGGPVGCVWDSFVEVAPFGAEERRMLHAEQRICTREDDGNLVEHGAIVLHVVLEYETLPFVTSQNPYFEIFRRSQAEPREGTPASNVEVAIYGWGLQPLYTSGPSAWPITDELFQRLYASRDPFWAEAVTGNARHHVYFSNNRERIFAIGYPILTPFYHFVHLAELTTFGGAVFVLVLIGTSLFSRIARERPRVGRALLREIRASFYRKLFLAFVLAAIIPVLILAVVIRTYFHNLLRSDIEAEAARTAAVAQRVIEESDALLRRSAEELGVVNDDVMVWVEQVIDQDVNLFKGARLVATSERDLFASGILPVRTPDDIYRAIVLQRLPSFVRQDAIGDFTYMLAAAPVRTAGQDTLLTVPLALRQREVEREIDELDRGIHLAALFFVLLGAGIGLSMAERIADPVRRLTRATGRIARGDFDARIAVKSVDELRRLVDAFNSMAAELKAQRAQLEKTHRLEAWAEMARQVAHEIKNPLTPIQLSAEHLRRVHADRGRPMGPLLDECITSILGQVRLLRQISSEFSNFASSPTARLAPADLTELVAEVINPYRTGIQDRIAILNRVPTGLPPVLVDRTLLGRALVNIVENALHAMPGPGTLTLDAEADGDGVRLVVADSGAGMDEEALGRVFEPYFSTKASGTGLGLPIAKRNIELSGGAVTVTSARGAGTTVTVRLPSPRNTPLDTRRLT